MWGLILYTDIEDIFILTRYIKLNQMKNEIICVLGKLRCQKFFKTVNYNLLT